MASRTAFQAPIAKEIWDLKYRLKTSDGVPVDRNLEDTFERVSRAAAGVEPGGRAARDMWQARFFDTISDFGFIPAGRILAGAGTKRDVTLFNCFVMGPIEDDLSGIFDAVKRAAQTMQSGGGIGVDFSTLRPNGALVKSIGAGASGPVSFMGVWDAMCQTIQSAGARRGAMMATLRADHPDIERFIDAKNEQGELTNFNLSVLVSDALMRAVRNDDPWDLKFDGVTYKTLRARDLWERIMRATYEYAEPGVIFIDRVNKQNNLKYCESIVATNPCGEQPLPPFGACLLGSINLTQLVHAPFTQGASIDVSDIDNRVHSAVRFLDNMIDVSKYPLKRQRKEARQKRRMGIGITGLADALIMCGLHYGSNAGRARAASWMEAIQNAAYLASARLAREKGAFPLYDEKEILHAPNVQRLPKDVRQEIKRSGLRNGCLTSIAPTGTISLLAGNVSSGAEPVFDFTFERAVTQQDGTTSKQRVTDHALAQFREKFGREAELPEYFVNATGLSPRQHLEMQAALQPFIDSAISKTINCPVDMSFEAFKDIYDHADRLGLKGCTTYRQSDVRGAVLSSLDENTAAASSDPRVPQDRAAQGQVSMSSTNSPVQDMPAVSIAPTNPKSQPLGEQHREREDAGKIDPKDAVPGTVVYMSQPLERSAELHGVTYKLKWPPSGHAIYVTINDTQIDGRRRPFEIFINTRNLEHYSWTVALTRMISAVFRRGGDVAFVAEELKAIFDPQGGAWVDGRYVPSLLAAIGDVIETHLQKIGFSPASAPTVPNEDPARKAAGADIEQLGADARYDATNVPPQHGDAPMLDRVAKSSPGKPQAPRGRLCPKCSRAHLVRRESCWECRDCGFSRCD